VKFFEDLTYGQYQSQHITSQELESEPILQIDKNYGQQVEIETTEQDLQNLGEYTMAYAAIQNFPSNFRKEEQKLSDFIPKTHQQAITCKFANE